MREQEKILAAKRAAKEEEEERRIRRAKVEERRSRVWDSSDDDIDEDDNDYESKLRIIRGRDGRLYYINNPSYSPPQKDPNYDDKEEEFEIVMSDDDDDDVSTRVEINHHQNCKTIGGSERNNIKGKRKRVTVIVEDASDSEYDDDDYNSPWRNRIPSPGQWIEPVENYHS